jgi:hypothetical protein
VLTFANPAFLWGLLGLAAPVLIHLINRDLFRPLHFPSIRFILRGKMPVERKRRLRDLLLLALRMLLFAAIVTALARPSWQPQVAAAPAEREAEIVLLLDASASMGGWENWLEATRLAESVLRENQDIPAGLVVSTQGPSLSLPPTSDHAELRRAIGSVGPLPVAGHHRESLREAVSLFRAGGERILVVISDLQATDWAPSALPRLPGDLEVRWLSTSGSSRENVGIVDARALPLPEGRRQVVAEVRNFGDEATGRTVRLRAGDVNQAQAIQIGAGQAASVVFVIDEEAALRAQLEIEADAYPLDDRFHLWLGPPPALRVLALGPWTEEPEKSEELFFVTRALQTRSENQWVNFQVDAVEPAALQPRQLDGVHAILLLGAAPHLSATQWIAIRERVEGGTRLLVTPGRAPARQTTLLAENGFLSLSFTGTAGTERLRRPHSIEWLRPNSPLALLFRDGAERSLSHVAIYRYLRFETTGEGANHLIRSGNGDPLLIDRALGAGRVYVSAFPFETAWTDLPLTTVFLPLIREVVGGDVSADHGIVYAETGTTRATLATRLGVPVDHSALAQIDPDRPGLHMIGATPLVLNVSRSESILEAADPIALQTAVTGPETLVATAGSGPDDGRRPLWPWFALAALLLFIIEMPLAARLRRNRKAAEPAQARSPAEEVSAVR